MVLGCLSSKARSVLALFIKADGVFGNASSTLIILFSLSFSPTCGRFLLDCKGTPKSLGGLLSSSVAIPIVISAADVLLGAFVADNDEICLRFL